MKVYFKSTTLTFQSAQEQVLSPTFTTWPSKYSINGDGVIINVGTFNNVAVSDAINCEGYSQLKITGCVGQTNNYASLCAFYSQAPTVGSPAGELSNQKMAGETSYLVPIPTGAKYLFVINKEHTTGGSIPSGSDPVYTLVP